MIDMLPPPSSSDRTRQPAKPLRFDYVPRPGLLKLTLVNLLLYILTLTIYRFWARTNVRKHIWSCVHINGQPLEYTGKGSELFKGALIVFGVLGLPAILAIAFVNIAYGPEHPAVGGIQLLLFLIVSLLWGAAVFRATALSVVAHPVARHPRRARGVRRYLLADLFRCHAGARHDAWLDDAGDEPQSAGTDDRRHAFR